MAAQQVSPQTTVTLNGSGDGQCSLTPPSGTLWQLALAALNIPNAILIPRAFLYLGSSSGPLTLIDSTYLGNSASSGKVAGAPFYHGTYLWAVWTGGDPGALATLQAYGVQVTGYRKTP
jgi:hypothetical protein